MPCKLARKPKIGHHPNCKEKGKGSQEDHVEGQIDGETEGSDPGYEPTNPRKRKAKAKSQSSGRKTKRPRASARKTVSASTKSCVDAPFLQFSPKSEDNSAKLTSDECPEDESSATKSDLTSIPEDALENWEEWKIPKPERDNSEDIPEERSVPAPRRRLRIVANRSRADSQMRSSTFQTPYDPASSSALQGSPSHPRGIRGPGGISDSGVIRGSGVIRDSGGFQGTAAPSSYGNEGRQSNGHFPSSRDYRYENPYVNWNPNENTVPLRETAGPMFHGLPVAPRQRVAEEVSFNVSDLSGQESYPAPGYDYQGFFESEMMGSMHDLNDGLVEPDFDPADTSYLQNAPNWMAGQGAPHSPINDWYQNNEAASLSLGYLPQLDNIEEELHANRYTKPKAKDADKNSS